MTDEMPLDIVRKRFMLQPQFLLMALTEDALAFLVSSLNIFVGMILANCHKADPLWQLIQHIMKMPFYIIHDITCAHTHP